MKCIILSILFLSAISSCAKKKSDSPDSSNPELLLPDFSKLTPSCFSAQSPSPVLSMGDLVTNGTWNDPHVIKVGSQYVMYVSADHGFDQNIETYRLVSSNGSNWTLSPSAPVFSKASGVADWDRKSVETPAVVLFKGTYYLFYTGYPLDLGDHLSYRIGYATSSDGISWTRQTPVTPLISPSGVAFDFHQFIVAEPAPVVVGDSLHLYFTAVGYDSGVAQPLQTIGFIKTTNGSTWTSPQKVLAPDQTIYPRVEGFTNPSGTNLYYGWYGYSTPNAVYMNGQVHLFFDVAYQTDLPPSGASSFWRQRKIHHAKSTDGISSWVQDSTSIFDRSQFTWTTEEVRSPSVLLDGTQLRMWFAGHRLANSPMNPSDSQGAITNYGVGFANCSLSP